MKNLCLLYVLLIISYDRMRSVGVKRLKAIKVDRFLGYCEGFENATMGLADLQLSQNGRTMVIDAKLVVKHDLEHEIEQVVELNRCKNKDSLDSCEKMQKMKFNRCCELLVAKGMIWTPFVDAIKPKIVCPVKEGVYDITKATFETTSLIDLGTYYWKMLVNSYDSVTRERLFCMYLEVSMITYVGKN